MPKKKDEEKLKSLSRAQRRELQGKPVYEKKEEAASGDEASSFDEEKDISEGAVLENGEATVVDEDADDETEVRVKKRLSRKQKLLIILLSIFAVIAIVLGSTANEMHMHRVYTQLSRQVDNPIVVFSLSNGDRIEIIVYEEEVPFASTNFLYLARSGFFNGVIIFDTTQNFVRFGQFTDTSFRNSRALSRNFVNRRDITRPDELFHPTRLYSDLDYRFTTHDTGARVNELQQRQGRRGYISQLHTLGSTEFQIANNYPDIAPVQIANMPRNVPNPVATHRPMQGRVFGRVTDSSLRTIDRIASMPQLDTHHPFWNPPATTIRITRTRVFGVDFWGKWRTFNFDNFFQPNGPLGRGSRVSWHTSPSGPGGIRRDMDNR